MEFRVLAIGDVTSEEGTAHLRRHLPGFKKMKGVDFRVFQQPLLYHIYWEITSAQSQYFGIEWPGKENAHAENLSESFDAGI